MMNVNKLSVPLCSISDYIIQTTPSGELKDECATAVIPDPAAPGIYRVTSQNGKNLPSTS